MGNGQVVGNQSVHWKFDHQSGAPLTVNQNNPNRPSGNHHVNMSDKAQGRDPKNVDYFDVTLRFEAQRGRPDPVAQLNEALKVAGAAAAGTSFFVTFKVPAKVNGSNRPSPDQPPGPDIGIEW
ncbi:MAG TPA: hypothetical protein VFO67_06930 [Gemmatimonadales bacterium]|nr:hypothetical protein [Gemmatimonadales bacterium]